jgi:uncharacterized protein (TIGR02145 family)
MKKKSELLIGLVALLVVYCEPEPTEPVGKSPVAAFTALPTTTAVGQSIQFTDQSANNPTSWLWAFGDGNTSTLQDPSHAYSSAGTYTVVLTVTNNFGSNDETKFNYITVNEAGKAPVAGFIASPRSIIAGQSVQFTDQSVNIPTSWSWDFGDGGTSTLQNPPHIYTTAGTYSVVLTVANNFGSDGETKINYITVNAAGKAPVAGFVASPRSITAGQSVQFTDQSANAPTSWSWNFGDGGTSTLQNPSHIYATTGTFTVTLTAANSFGTDSEIKSDYIAVSEMTSGSFTDSRDGLIYNWVKIGNQIWMAENLAYLPSVNPPTVGSTTEMRYYVPGYDGSNLAAAVATSNYSTYGVLYNWPAAMNGSSSSNSNPSGVRGVCPSGWHLPSVPEWTELTDYLGGEAIAGGKMKETGTVHWEDPNNGATNESGFTGLPAGYRNKNDNTFSNFTTYALFWSTTAYSSSDAWGRGLYNHDTQVYNYNYYKDHGFSVRCIKD